MVDASYEIGLIMAAMETKGIKSKHFLPGSTQGVQPTATKPAQSAVPTPSDTRSSTDSESILKEPPPHQKKPSLLKKLTGRK